MGNSTFRRCSHHWCEQGDGEGAGALDCFNHVYCTWQDANKVPSTWEGEGGGWAPIGGPVSRSRMAGMREHFKVLFVCCSPLVIVVLLSSCVRGFVGGEVGRVRCYEGGIAVQATGRRPRLTPGIPRRSLGGGGLVMQGVLGAQSYRRMAYPQSQREGECACTRSSVCACVCVYVCASRNTYMRACQHAST